MTRRFGDLIAVNNLTFEAPKGSVVGFVGPNGSGKSTTIRILLGLIAASDGHAEVLGEPITHPERFADRVGALIENPAFVGSLSARDNLRSLAALRGLPDRQVDEALDIVGLSSREKDQAKTYSHGMKQRLGIAAALLNDPDLLVLDEPMNGLDPAWMARIRQFLQNFAGDSRTVILSSHLLSEIQAICTHLVIIRFGELLFSGSLDELMTGAAQHVVAAPEHAVDTPELREIYTRQGWEASVEEGEVHVKIPANLAADANRLATSAGITLRKLSPVQDNLEEVFLSLTGSGDDETVNRRG